MIERVVLKLGVHEDQLGGPLAAEPVGASSSSSSEKLGTDFLATTLSSLCPCR